MSLEPKRVFGAAALRTLCGADIAKCTSSRCAAVGATDTTLEHCHLPGRQVCLCRCEHCAVRAAIEADWILSCSFVQHSAHRQLAALRAPSQSASKAKHHKYSIPIGWCFQSISCPHYLSDLAIYLSLALFAGSNLLLWCVNCATTPYAHTHAQ